MYFPTKLGLATVLSAALSLPLSAQDKPYDQVVATVNGVDITVGHIALARANLPDQYQNLGAQVLYDGLLEQLIQQTVLMQALEDTPTHLKMLLENNRRQAIANEALTVLLDEAVTEDAVQARYAAEFQDYQPETEWNASHILVETEEKAQEILELAQGGDDFAALAREHSTGPSGPGGGELGWFGPGRMVPEFETAVMDMEVGAVTGPVQTQFGFHVIRLNDKRDLDAPELEEVREDIVNAMQREIAESLVADLTAGAEVTITEGVDASLIVDPAIFAK